MAIQPGYVGGTLPKRKASDDYWLGFAEGKAAAETKIAALQEAVEEHLIEDRRLGHDALRAALAKSKESS